MMVNVGKYTIHDIHGSYEYGILTDIDYLTNLTCFNLIWSPTFQQSPQSLRSDGGSGVECWNPGSLAVSFTPPENRPGPKIRKGMACLPSIIFHGRAVKLRECTGFSSHERKHQTSLPLISRNFSRFHWTPVSSINWHLNSLRSQRGL